MSLRIALTQLQSNLTATNWKFKGTGRKNVLQTKPQENNSLESNFASDTGTINPSDNFLDEQTCVCTRAVAVKYQLQSGRSIHHMD